jgi:hypothetical protein
MNFSCCQKQQSAARALSVWGGGYLPAPLPEFEIRDLPRKLHANFAKVVKCMFFRTLSFLANTPIKSIAAK